MMITLQQEKKECARKFHCVVLGILVKLRHNPQSMEQLVSTTDAVRLSFLCSLLSGAGVPVEVFDVNISALEAGIGAFPRRIMVPAESLLTAKMLLKGADEFYND